MHPDNSLWQPKDSAPKQVASKFTTKKDGRKINSDEMISFLLIGILQALYPLPEEESYFSFNGFGAMLYFTKIMSHNRDLLLKSFLYFTDNETCIEPTRLSKIQSVTDYF